MSTTWAMLGRSFVSSLMHHSATQTSFRASLSSAPSAAPTSLSSTISITLPCLTFSAAILGRYDHFPSPGARRMLRRPPTISSSTIP
ncbi:putative receptor-like protein kinase [Iris pallida]|uniref:Receptor-like protein kinase n=1 Tax=Iris pallida TaxID=29817 RepID=A0AAX6I277_IRIPA|nr:putative receptor-like protein kinase [Iris pallida]KAJ6847061.1 putative receptor-like protein kinase [Iris pallida]